MQELQQNQFQKRQIAYKISISDILSVSLDNTNISRVNVIATVVFKSEHGSNVHSVIVDDGTGKILLRSFENAVIFSKVDVGDFVLVIGKIREFNRERYVLAEIVKKINNPEWVNIRKQELKNINYNIQNVKIENTDAVEDVEENSMLSRNDEVYSLIRSLDSGEGVLVDEIIRKFNDNKTEKIINNLLESGDIFEVSPGKLKVLE